MNTARALLTASILSLTASLTMVPAQAEKVSHSILNGQTIHTDGFGSVKLRAKTLTIGGCALRVRLGSNFTTDLFATPLAYSEWKDIGATTGGPIKISFRKLCSNVPVVAEAQYFNAVEADSELDLGIDSDIDLDQGVN